MKLAALFSGGKDSVFAVHDMQRKKHEIACLITMLPKNPESYMFHYPNLDFTRYQAQSMGIEQIFWKTPGEKEREISDLKEAISSVSDRIDGVIAGGLASRYQHDRIRKVCDSLDLQTFVPYWMIESEKYWRIMLNEGFRVMITGVACEGLGREWLGRIIDRESFRELRSLAVKHRFHLAGEGGEFETFVTNGPNFRRGIEIVKGEVTWERDSGVYLFRKARLKGP